MTLIRKPMNQNNGCLNAGFKLTTILIVIASICFVLFSCSTYKCYPSKRDYSKIIIEHENGNSEKQKLPRSV